MPLPPFLQRKSRAGDPGAERERRAAVAADEGGAVEQARIRARRRLIGAAVLLGVGLVVFPLLFETRPRPVALDIPIETPRRDSGPVQAPPAEPALAGGRAAASAAAAQALPVEPAGGPAPVEAAAATAASTPALTAAPAPSATASAAGARSEDGSRARALLDGTATPRPVDAAASQPARRFVVQVGAYTDSTALREAREKVERLGMKTYTQVIEADGTRRTRVRIGPFASREEADRAVAKLKAAGLPTAVLQI